MRKSANIVYPGPYILGVAFHFQHIYNKMNMEKSPGCISNIKDPQVVKVWVLEQIHYGIVHQQIIYLVIDLE